MVRPLCPGLIWEENYQSAYSPSFLSFPIVVISFSSISCLLLFIFLLSSRVCIVAQPLLIATGFRFPVAGKPHCQVRFGLLVFSLLIPTNQGRQLKLCDMLVSIWSQTHCTSLLFYTCWDMSGTLESLVLGRPTRPEVLRKETITCPWACILAP